MLLLLAPCGREDHPESIIPQISQETLAEMVGTTRSRVSFFINRFKKLGFIEYMTPTLAIRYTGPYECRPTFCKYGIKLGSRDLIDEREKQESETDILLNLARAAGEMLKVSVLICIYRINPS